MCDCAEELERRERAKAEELENAMAALRAQGNQPSLVGRLLGFLGLGSGKEGGWLPFIGGTALLVGLLGFIYKKFGDRLLKMLGGKRGKVDPCERASEVKTSPPPPNPIKPCHCNS